MSTPTKVVFQEAAFENTDTNEAPIDRDALPEPVLGLLDSWGLTTHGLLQCVSEDDMMRIHHPGNEFLDAIETYLGERELRLREDDEPLLRRIEEIYGHVRRAPVEILVLQMDELSLNSINLFPAASVKRIKARGIHVLGHFEGRPVGLLETFFPPADDDQIAAVHWLEGMLQMAGIRLLVR